MSEFRWLEGALREESGAAITVGEYDTKGTAFFARTGLASFNTALRKLRSLVHWQLSLRECRFVSISSGVCIIQGNKA